MVGGALACTAICSVNADDRLPTVSKAVATTVSVCVPAGTVVVAANGVVLERQRSGRADEILHPLHVGAGDGGSDRDLRAGARRPGDLE